MLTILKYILNYFTLKISLNNRRFLKIGLVNTTTKLITPIFNEKN